MRWLSLSLNRKSAVGTAAGLLISSLVFLVMFVRLYSEQLEAERISAAAEVNRLLQISLENAMLKRDLEGLKKILDRLAEQPSILRTMITNPGGEVRFSSDPTRLGTHLTSADSLPAEPFSAFRQGPGGERILRSVNPVRNKPSCQECHGAAQTNPINGVLYVDYDGAPILWKARNTTLLLMGSGAVIVLINIAGGWWFLRRVVIQPVSHLSAVSRRLKGGELDARVKVSGRDELATLGTHFNQMAAALQVKIRDLAEKEQFLQQLVNAIPDGIRVIDADYRVILCNSTYRAQLGLEGEGATPDACYAAAHGRDTPCPTTLLRCPLREVTETGEPLRVVHEHHRLDGGRLHVEIYAAPLRITRDGKTRTLVVESVRDLDQQIKFSHEQKLSELGRLAAGVAHEIHNPLASVRLALHAAKHAADPEQLAGHLATVDQQIDQCIHVTERLLRLSVPPAEDKELVAVDVVVNDTLRLLQWEAENLGVAMGVSADEPPLRVMASDSELRMVALNLAQNALHAMPRGGRLDVSCRRRDGQIELAFSDTGVGIRPEDRLQIFEPFFSRRADGVRGTGLGLSITKALLEKHGGSITVESAPGRGSRFAVRLEDADSED
jgi:signal transduction histidine kinase